jgi:hypothetical protein
MTATSTLTWPETFEAFGIDWDAPILIAGTDAISLVETCARRGSAGIAAEGDDWFLLAPNAPDEAPDSWVDLTAGIAGTVVVRRAWGERSELGAATAAAARLLGEGGRLYLADLDVDRLLGSSPVHYPYQLRFTLDADAEAALRKRSTPVADLALEVGRAGLLPVTGVVVEEQRAVYDRAASYWTAVRDGAWPSLAAMPADRRERLLEDLAVALERIAPMGEIVERRPWFVATGMRA